MSKLRNRIDDIVALAYYEGSDSRPLLPDWTDRILAHVAEAMLSTEAVDAHLMRTWGWYDYDKGLWYDDAPEDVKEGARDDARHGVEGALVAAGITVAGQEGGEGE